MQQKPKTSIYLIILLKNTWLFQNNLTKFERIKKLIL